MHIRKERTHLCGLSNIDFKTRKDNEGFNTYKQDLRSTHVGTMGKTAMKKIVLPTTKLESLKITSGFTLPSQPNPKMDSSFKYYRATAKEILAEQSISAQKDSKLESAKFTGKPMTGEDVKMANWYAHQSKKYGQSDQDKSSTEDNKDEMKTLLLKGDKLEKNEKAITETQLVKVKAKHTLDGKVDIEKVRGIRRTIRRRYGNRTNFRKLFNNWDRTSKGFIDTTDAYHIVNKLGIKINQNEAAVLIASADKKGKGVLGMDEFMSLIFGSEEAFNVDLHKIREVNDDGAINNSVGLIEKMNEATSNLKTMEEFTEARQLLQRKAVDMFSDIQYGRLERNVDFNAFREVIKEKGNLPDKYLNEVFLDKLFKICPSTSEGKIDFVRFLDTIKKFRIHEHSDSDLGSPKKAIKAQSMKKDGEEKQINLYITGKTKIPINKLETLIGRAKRLAHIIQNKWPNQEDFKKELNAKTQGDRVSQNTIKEFIVDQLQTQLQRRDLHREDIDSFLFALPYDNNKAVNPNDMIYHAYRNDIDISKCYYEVHKRGLCPISQPTLSEDKKKEVEPERIRKIFEELSVKLSDGNVPRYVMYKKFDADNDGIYIT